MKRIAILLVGLACSVGMAQDPNRTPPPRVLLTSGTGLPPFAPLALASGLDSQGDATPPGFVPMCSATGLPPFSQCTFSGGGPTFAYPTGTGLVRVAAGAAWGTTAELSGDCTTSGSNAITCAKTGGVAFAPSATTDTTNANNISSGTLPCARLPALTGDATSSAGNCATSITSLPLSHLAAQAADTVVQNATGGSAVPTAVAMPTCTTGADLYNTSTHTWSCVAIPATPAMVNITPTVTIAGACVVSGGNCVTGTPGASITLSNIPGTYSHLRLVINGASSAVATTDDILIQFNSDTTTGHYSWQLVNGNNTSAAGLAVTSDAQLHAGGFAGASATNIAGTADILFSNYAGTTFNKTYLSTNGRPSNNGGTTWQIFAWTGMWASQTAITTIKLFPAGGNFVAGSSVTLYGIL